MNTKSPKTTALTLSTVVVVLAVISSLGGLFLNDLYRDNHFVTTAWKENDFVTLVVAVPLMILAMAFVRRGSIRAELLWLGMLEYMIYNFAYYLFGAAFNWFFLLYIAVITLAGYAFIFGLINIDAISLSQKFRTTTPVKLISGYMLFVAIGLSIIYIAQSLDFIISGTLPPVIELVDHPTNVVFALDFLLLISVLVLGAIWLRRRQPWGYVLAGIVLVKGATYTLVLTVVAIGGTQAGIAEASGELPFWAFITVVGTIACVSLYRNLDINRG